jgi:hypothetical protein
MKRQWNVDELIDLLPPEMEWLGNNDDHKHLDIDLVPYNHEVDLQG